MWLNISAPASHVLLNWRYSIVYTLLSFSSSQIISLSDLVVSDALTKGLGSWAAVQWWVCSAAHWVPSKTTVLVQWLVLFPSLIRSRWRSTNHKNVRGKMLPPYWNGNQSMDFKAAHATWERSWKVGSCWKCFTDDDFFFVALNEWACWENCVVVYQVIKMKNQYSQTPRATAKLMNCVVHPLRATGVGVKHNKVTQIWASEERVAGLCQRGFFSSAQNFKISIQVFQMLKCEKKDQCILQIIICPHVDVVCYDSCGQTKCSSVRLRRKHYWAQNKSNGLRK